MKNRQILKQATIYLTHTLTGYEVIPASEGWHIHKENTYCGMLQYQGKRGWQGSALNYISSELKDELKKFAQLVSSMPKFAA